jgi:hypothetical protein
MRRPSPRAAGRSSPMCSRPTPTPKTGKIEARSPSAHRCFTRRAIGRAALAATGLAFRVPAATLRILDRSSPVGGLGRSAPGSARSPSSG